ncbi:IS66 family insertion sequence element accessory protein TnpB [Klebsiella pneumoniae]|uniref:IS66 family insertion sequence element accessory protein TnpB n=1 Tax=Klebsiella pneumoniae TaxID=573 RepID=UPI003A5CB708
MGVIAASGKAPLVYRRWLCLLTKRLERGRFARRQPGWQSVPTPAQLAMLLEGIDWRQPKKTAYVTDHVVGLFIPGRR